MDKYLINPNATSHGDSIQELLEKAFKNIVSKFGWGNYLFYMDKNLVMETAGGAEEDYIGEMDEIVMVVFINGHSIFSFRWSYDKYFDLKVYKMNLTIQVLINLIENKFQTKEEFRMGSKVLTLDKAIAIAANAFVGKYDKAGQPYILHCLAVMNGVKRWNNEELSIGAVLHDLVEDTNWTFDQLEQEGASKRVIKMLRLVTRTAGKSYEDEINEICTDFDAIRIKMSDLEHNSDITRLKGIRDKDLERMVKYNKAYHQLQDALARF